MAAKKKPKNVFEFGSAVKPLIDSYAGPDGFAFESDSESSSILLLNSPNGQMIAIWSLEQADYIHDAMEAIIDNRALPPKA